MADSVPKTASDPMSARTPTFYYDSARQGMRDLLSRHCGRKSTVLLPAYIGWSKNEGSGVYDPIAELDLNTRFYRVTSDLDIDVDDLDAKLEGASDPIVVIIHYFGRTDPSVERVASVARRHGALVIEDAAHAFYSAMCGGVAGRHGDAVVYSLHKMFPTPGHAGGMVTYRNPLLVTGQQSTRPDLANFILDYDWFEIARRRKSNFLAMSKLLRQLGSFGSQFELMWGELGSNDVPQTLPVRVLNGARDRVYHAMNAAGFGMVSLYHTLISELQTYSEMVSVSQSVINFPVHQDVDRGQIEPMVLVFDASLRGRGDL